MKKTPPERRTRKRLVQVDRRRGDADRLEQVVRGVHCRSGAQAAVMRPNQRYLH